MSTQFAGYVISSGAFGCSVTVAVAATASLSLRITYKGQYPSESKKLEGRQC